MPGLVRKVLISTTIEGVVLQAHGLTEQHKAIFLDFETRRISAWKRPGGFSAKDEPRLESHGIIGLINIASVSFLLAVTKREQVAQVYGKPVFVVTDVALLPLSSQKEANEAILAACKERPADEGISDSEDSDVEDDHQSVTGMDLHSPIDDHAASQPEEKGSTKIAQNVAQGKALYGKFASEWFSKRVWGNSRPSQVVPGVNSFEHNHTDSKPLSKDEAVSKAARTNDESPADTADRSDASNTAQEARNVSTLSLLPKIVRSTKMILSSRSFYFSYDFDLTRRFSLLGGRLQAPARATLDPLYFWNRRMGSVLLEASQDAFLLPIIQGFVGQRTFTVQSSDSDDGESQHLSTTSAALEKDSASPGNRDRTFLLTLISRRSTKRSGLRYLRRGIDDKGNCANAAETEQILSSPTWDTNASIRAFVQVRGSIPLYFSQSPYSLKPVPMFHNSPAANRSAFKKHMQDLKNRYGAVQIAMLVNKHGTEATIGEAYEKLYTELQHSEQLSDVHFEWFDFHAECRGMKFENVQHLVTKFRERSLGWGESIIMNEQIQQVQSGVIRTNCMDCLDRTNVAQSAFGQYVLQQSLEAEGYKIDLLHDERTNWFNTLWADNGDAISRQYASTAALKGDFTRTRKRNWQGAMNDLGLTLSRYYSNMVNDYFSQAVIDVLLGNVSWRIFEDFESTMMSADPGISVASAREAAIENCAKIVIQGEHEDLIHGWTMLSPAHENTLRTLPFEETVVLLTDAAVYCCKFDWNTEKIARFEKVDLRSVRRIRYGSYITSTFTARQLDEELNQGIVLVFDAGQGDMIRVNTRSLQNHVATDSTSTSVDGGTGILSWFNPATVKISSRTMALKVILDDDLEADESRSSRRSELPKAIAERMSDEIRRAIEGPQEKDDTSNLVEEGDIISAAEAKRRTGYLEQLGHSLKRMVWA